MRLIDADALENAMARRFKELESKNGPYDHYTTGFDDAITYVEEAPTIDAVPVVHARWEDESDGYRNCSKCGCEHPMRDARGFYVDDNYCPNCGAKMDGGAEE